MRPNPERLIFDEDRKAQAEYDHPLKPFVKDGRGWMLFGQRDIRDRDKRFLFCLQKLPKQKLPRVRVGCRYFTLKQAWKHWGTRKKHLPCSRVNERRQAVAIIRLMLLQAQQFHLLSFWQNPPKFDSSLLKPKRKS